MRFRKKPVVIEAVQFTRSTLAELDDFAGDNFDAFGFDEESKLIGAIKTLEDGSGTNAIKHIATEGDWIIKGVQGEFYACKPDIFEATYERVE